MCFVETNSSSRLPNRAPPAVLGRRNLFQMVWIAAKRRSAEMIDLQTGDKRLLELVQNSVSVHQSLLNSDDPVTPYRRS